MDNNIVYELVKILPETKFELSVEYDDTVVYHNSSDLRINLGKYAHHIEEIQSRLNNEFILKYKPAVFGEKYSDEVLNYFNARNEEAMSQYKASLDYENTVSEINKSVGTLGRCIVERMAPVNSNINKLNQAIVESITTINRDLAKIFADNFNSLCKETDNSNYDKIFCIESKHLPSSANDNSLIDDVAIAA